MTMKKARSVMIVKPGWVEVRESDCPDPGDGQVWVTANISAISAGTELLGYRGELPDQSLSADSVDQTVAAPGYPRATGYAVVGETEDGRRVFCLKPHASGFWAREEELNEIPDDIADEDAVFFANMETAVTLVQDGGPVLGERVAVFGQGVVGILASGVLSRFPLGSLIVFDTLKKRLQVSAEWASETVRLEGRLPKEYDGMFDLVFEVSGSEAGANAALQSAMYTGRVVAGSWFGSKTPGLELGGSFHRRRLRIISSQVSTMDPGLAGRWSAARRREAVWDSVRVLKPHRLVSDRIPVDAAPEAYQNLANGSDRSLQVILQY